MSSSLCLCLLIVFSVTLGASLKGEGPVWDGKCNDDWFTSNLNIAHSTENWELKYTEFDISIYSRDSNEPHTTAWLFKAVVPDLPVPISRVRHFLYDDFYNKENLAVWYPRFMEGWVVKQYSNDTSLVYEIHDRYRTLTFPRDYVLARCIKELDNGGFILLFRSVRDENFPDDSLELSRSYYQRLAFIVEPSPLGEQYSQLTLVEQEEIECCVPQKGLDQHRPYSIVKRLLGIRKLLGGRGRCIGDRTREDYDLLPSCHLTFEFAKHSCSQVFDHIRNKINQEDPRGGWFRLNKLTSDNECLEIYHDAWIPWGEDVHFEPISTHTEGSCTIQARSSSRVIWGFDDSMNYCNIINLIEGLGDYKLSYGQPTGPGNIFECMYRPGDSEDPIKACSAKTRTWANTFCALDAFKWFC